MSSKQLTTLSIVIQLLVFTACSNSTSEQDMLENHSHVFQNHEALITHVLAENQSIVLISTTLNEQFVLAETKKGTYQVFQIDELTESGYELTPITGEVHTTSGVIFPLHNDQALELTFGEGDTRFSAKSFSDNREVDVYLTETNKSIMEAIEEISN